MICLRPLWPFDHVLNIMLGFYAFVLMYDIGIKFDMIDMIYLYIPNRPYSTTTCCNKITTFIISTSGLQVRRFRLKGLPLLGVVSSVA